MPHVLQVCAYAARARAILKRTARQARELERARARFYHDVWREASSELGAAFEVLSDDILEISCNGATTRVWNNFNALDDPVTVRLACDKPHVHALLRSRGLPTPDWDEFSVNDLGKAYAFLREHGPCVVVKPAAGTGGGEGVTTGIRSRWQLLAAAVKAAGYSRRLLIEKQVEGDNFRLLYLDGELLDAVGRLPPTVVGDGTSKVSRLVEQLNQGRLDAGHTLAQSMLRYDLEMKTTLARQGLSWRAVPADGQRVMLKNVINDNMAAENTSIRGELPECTIADGRRAAELVGARLAGVDIVTPKVRESLKEAGGVVLEVNTMPGYYYHYFKNGERCAVAVPILKACLSRGHPGKGTWSRRSIS